MISRSNSNPRFLDLPGFRQGLADFRFRAVALFSQGISIFFFFFLFFFYFLCNLSECVWMAMEQVVQGIISELESQGALPRSNSRVSSLATCCGPRLVCLLVIGCVMLC